jgi:hypothetical protein
MARGGSLPGERRGGRQKGTPNKRTEARAAFQAGRLDVSGASPLDIILGAARAAWAEAHRTDGVIDLRMARVAADIAKDAAPYLHSKLMPASQPGGDDDMAKARRIKGMLDEIEGAIDQPDTE